MGLEGIAAPLRVPGGMFGIIPARTAHRALGDNGTPAVRIGVTFSPHPARCAGGTPFSAAEIRRMFARIAASGATAHRFTPRLAAILHDLMAA